MLSRTILCLMLLMALSPAAAQDGLEPLASGGLVFSPMRHVSLLREDVAISPSRITVRYVLRNEGPEPEQLRMTFPLPALDPVEIFEAGPQASRRRAELHEGGRQDRRGSRGARSRRAGPPGRAGHRGHAPAPRPAPGSQQAEPGRSLAARGGKPRRRAAGCGPRGPEPGRAGRQAGGPLAALDLSGRAALVPGAAPRAGDRDRPRLRARARPGPPGEGELLQARRLPGPLSRTATASTDPSRGASRGCIRARRSRGWRRGRSPTA